MSLQASPTRLIIDPPQSGSCNMAVDEALLTAAVDGGPATLRLYQWSEPTLSLGYFQHYDDRDEHAASRTSAVVRRQSGGGAILHDRELTYSLTLPPGHPLATDATALYNSIHNAFIALLTPKLSAESATQWQLALHRADCRRAPNEEPFLCFERRACGDLVLEPTATAIQVAAATNSVPRAYKIMGSAQRRHRGAILQHGSLLIAQSPAAPELPGWQELTGTPLPIDELMSSVVRQLFGLLNLDAAPAELPASIRDMARRIDQEKYSSRSWTARR
jgi:lipoate-protein ligase A